LKIWKFSLGEVLVVIARAKPEAIQQQVLDCFTLRVRNDDERVGRRRFEDCLR
jgi:hypothetical protein